MVYHEAYALVKQSSYIRTILIIAPSFVSKNQVSKESKKCLDVINKLKTEYKKSSSKIKNNPAITKLMNMQLSFVDDKSFRESVLK